MEPNITRLVEHVVGMSEHIHDQSNLMVKTRCSAKLSSPYGAIFPFSTLFEKLETLVSSGALVTGSNELQISVHFVTDDMSTQDVDTTAFMQDLATIFCGAEMWKQLGLKACQVIPPSDQNFSCHFKDLYFSLRHLAPGLNSSDESDGEQSFPSHSIMQPAGIPSVLLERIQIDFSFSYLRSCSNGKRNKFEYLNGVDFPMLLTDYMATQVKQSDLSRPLICKAALSTPSQNQQGGLLPTRGLDSTQDQKMLMSDCLLGFSGQVLAKELGFGRSLVKRPAAEYMEREIEIVFADLAKLVDAGLRTMLCGENIELLNGVRLLTGPSGPRLAEISPALFKPAYLSAVLDHSQFVDSIANTISAIHRHCHSSSLRSKIEALQNFAPDEYVENDLGRIQQSPNDRLLNAVKVRLWKLIFSGLLCGPGNIELTPLDWTETSFGRERAGQSALEQGNRIFSNNAHHISTKAEGGLLSEHQSLASKKKVDIDLFESDLFDFELEDGVLDLDLQNEYEDEDLSFAEDRGLDLDLQDEYEDEDLCFAEDGMLDLDLQDEYEDEDLFWEDGYETTATLSNNSGEAAFDFENIVLLADDDEKLLLLDGGKDMSSKTHGQGNRKIISSGNHEAYDDEVLIEI